MNKNEACVRFLMDAGLETWAIVGIIHGWYQEYEIDEDEESYLYTIADPDEQWNDCWDYWDMIDEEKIAKKISSMMKCFEKSFK